MRGRWALPPAEGKGSRQGKGKWQEANRHHQLQTATHPSVMPTPPPPPPNPQAHAAGVRVFLNCTKMPPIFLATFGYLSYPWLP